MLLSGLGTSDSRRNASAGEGGCPGGTGGLGTLTGAVLGLLRWLTGALKEIAQRGAGDVPSASRRLYSSSTPVGVWRQSPGQRGSQQLLEGWAPTGASFGDRTLGLTALRHAPYSELRSGPSAPLALGVSSWRGVPLQLFLSETYLKGGCTFLPVSLGCLETSWESG